MSAILASRWQIWAVVGVALVVAILAAVFVVAGSGDDEHAGDPTRTGIAEVDQIVDLLLDGSRVDLLSALRMQMVPCTLVQGMGGPPKCWQAAPPQSGDVEKSHPPPGTPPEGTPIEVFPISSCELEWRDDLEPIVDHLMAYPLELFAVIAFDTGPFKESFLPRARHGIVLEGDSPQVGLLGVMVLVQDAAIVYLDWLCFGDASLFFTGAVPPYRDARVILHGPAWR